MKNWWESRTVWLNVTMTALLIAEMAAQLEPQFIGATAWITGTANIILRVWFTDMGIRK